MQPDFSDLPKSKKEALFLGVELYFTGKPCKRGHIAPHRIMNCQCLACVEAGVYRDLARVSEAKYRASNRELIAEKSRRLRIDKPLTTKAYSAKWRANNREYIIEKSRRDYAEDPQAAKTRWHNRRARLKEAEGQHTAQDIKEINARQGFICVYCGTSTAKKKSVDHITPLSRGGSNWPDNIQIICLRCNKTKHTKTDEEFRFLLEHGLTAVNDNKIKRKETA